MPAARAAAQVHDVPIHHDGWAILALPAGERDLACPDVWRRSLERSRQRRELPRRGGLARTGGARLSIALAAAALAAPAADVAAAQGTTTVATPVLRTLSAGSRGTAVVALQRALGVPADGIFGPQTRRAVRAFQRAHDLVADGVVGPLTARALGLGSAGAHVRSVAGAPAAAPTAATGATGATTDTAVAGVGAAAAIAAARSAIGAPYAAGATGPSSFDCSGLTVWAFRHAGITLPRTSFAQYGVGAAVARSAIAPGDLVFFDTDGSGASHVGIATSATTAISATSHGVREHAIDDSYWGSHLLGARRVI